MTPPDQAPGQPPGPGPGHVGPGHVGPDDDELELIVRSGVVLRVGRLSLSAGTGSYRVKQSMARVARALDIDRHEALVTLTEITATSHRGRSFRTEVTETHAIGINAARLADLEDLATHVERRGRVEPAEVGRALDSIERTPALYGRWANALWAAMACAAFAFLTGGGLVEIIAVFFGAFAGQLGRRELLHRGVNQFAATMVVAAVACLVYVGIVDLLHATGLTATNHQSGYVASVLFLVPGFALVTGFLDLAKSDFSAGLARLTYALTILASAALSVWGISLVVGLTPDPTLSPTLPTGLMVTLRFVASFAGVLGFALLFNSPWRMALGAAAIGMVANVARIELVSAGMAAQAATFLGALLAGLLTADVAPRLRVPRITVSVPAVVIMVPGVLAYRSVFYLSNGDTTQALASGVDAALAVVALAIGLAIARMLTDRSWAFDR